MNKLSKKLLESLDNLDSYILCEHTHLTEAKDNIHVTVITGDNNENFIKANRRKIVDAYTNGPWGFFFTKGVPSGDFEYDNNDGLFTDGEEIEPVSDPEQLYLPDGSINKDYIISEYGLTKWDGTYYGADGSVKHFTFGEPSDEEKAARDEEKAARAEEKKKDQNKKELEIKVAEAVQKELEDRLDMELTCRVRHEEPYSGGYKATMFKYYDKSNKLVAEGGYYTVYRNEEKNPTFDEAREEVLNDCLHCSAFEKVAKNLAKEETKKGGTAKNRLGHLYGKPLSYEEVLKYIPKVIESHTLKRKVKITVDTNNILDSYKVGKPYIIPVSVDVSDSELKKLEGTVHYGKPTAHGYLYIGPYSKTFGDESYGYIDEHGNQVDFICNWDLWKYMDDNTDLTDVGSKGSVAAAERSVISYLKQTGQLK